MSVEKVVRYTAGEIARMRDDRLRGIASEAMYPKARIAAIDAVDSVEFVAYDDVAGMVEALEALIVEWESKVRDRDNDYNAGWDHAGQSHAEQVRTALARFQP